MLPAAEASDSARDPANYTAPSDGTTPHPDAVATSAASTKANDAATAGHATASASSAGATAVTTANAATSGYREKGPGKIGYGRVERHHHYRFEQAAERYR
jgi:hypothetical protein